MAQVIKSREEREMEIMNEMKKEEFFDYVKEQVNIRAQEELCGAKINLVSIAKSNGREMTGLVFETKKEGASGRPVVYLDEYFERYQAGEAAVDLVSDMVEKGAHFLEIAEDSGIDMVVYMLKDYEKAKENIRIRLCDTELNAEWLRQLVHYEIGDYSMTYLIKVPNTKFNVPIRWEMLEAWRIPAEQLRSDALMIQREKHKPVSASTIAVIEATNLHGIWKAENLLNGAVTCKCGNDGTLYVLTNESREYGANILAQKEILEKIGNILGMDYYILPSSIHELMILPVSTYASVDELSEMVRCINRSGTVGTDDLLSDKVQYYDREKMMWENAKRRAEREVRKGGTRF